MHTLNRADTELVPILVKVQLLQTRLLGEPDAFATAWNWIDAFLRFEHNEPTYLMLRQAMASRRALLLLFEAPRSSQPHAANRARNSGGRLVDLQIYFSFGLSRLLRLANDFLKRRKP